MHRIELLNSVGRLWAERFLAANSDQLMPKPMQVAIFQSSKLTRCFSNAAWRNSSAQHQQAPPRLHRVHPLPAWMVRCPESRRKATAAMLERIVLEWLEGGGRRWRERKKKKKKKKKAKAIERRRRRREVAQSVFHGGHNCGDLVVDLESRLICADRVPMAMGMAKNMSANLPHVVCGRDLRTAPCARDARKA